jgi:hypothetical protein
LENLKESDHLKVPVGKRQLERNVGKRPLERLKRKWMNNIKINLQGLKWGGGRSWPGIFWLRTETG